MEDTSNWYGPDAATFGDRVAAARQSAGMTQAACAKRLGIRLDTLRGWEDDVKEPRANRLSMLAGLLNVSMMWLINGEGEGIEGPEDSATVEGDIGQVMGEMRTLSAQMHRNAERMAQLEKRLRTLIDQPAHV